MTKSDMRVPTQITRSAAAAAFPVGGAPVTPRPPSSSSEPLRIALLPEHENLAVRLGHADAQTRRQLVTHARIAELEMTEPPASGIPQL